MENKNYPELIFGLVGAIGCNIHGVQTALADALKEVDYTPHVIELSESIKDLIAMKKDCRPELKTLEEKIDAGNEVRALFAQKGILAVDAVRKIRQARSAQHLRQATKMPELEDNQGNKVTVEPEDFPAERTAYIIRQLKRKEEIQLLEKIYGKRFIQVSISQDKSSRISNIVQRSGIEQPGLNNDEKENLARKLVKRDENEDEDEFGG